MVRKVCVIGAGVNGLGSAVLCAETFDRDEVEIYLIAEQISPNTTGDGSAGLWSPYILGSTPEQKILNWAKITFDYMHSLWKSGKAAQTGICLQSATRLTTETIGYMPYYKDIVFGCTALNEKQLEEYSKDHNKKYTGGFNFTTFTCEPTLLLPYLMEKFLAAGGQFKQQKLNSIDEILDEFDVIINCTGLGAKSLVLDDAVTPVRGQVIRVQAPWIYEVFFNDSINGNYIIPNIETVVLGGTQQVGNFSRDVSKDDTKFIWHNCAKIIPSVSNAPIQKEWVGLRPVRSSVRLESTKMQTKNGKMVSIIHNYGHGGSGVTLFWGCAFDVLNLLKNDLGDDSKLKF